MHNNGSKTFYIGQHALHGQFTLKAQKALDLSGNLFIWKVEKPPQFSKETLVKD